MALKIGDFGLSLFLDEKSKEYRQKVGTHSYMAP